MTRALGVLTIGQSPRRDGLAREIQQIVGTGLRVVERGALDGLGHQEIVQMAPASGDYRLITLLRDGTSVELAKRHILDLLQRRIIELEEEEEVVGTLLMCTGAFPDFTHRRPLVKPQQALYATVAALADGGRVAGMLPLESQLAQGRDKWREYGVDDPHLVHASPYARNAIDEVGRAAAAAHDAGASILFMDCFGYDLTMKAAARSAFAGPVVLARSLAARLVAELLDSAV